MYEKNNRGQSGNDNDNGDGNDNDNENGNDNDSDIHVFKISELGPKKTNIDSLKKKTLISKKYNKNRDNIVMDISSFKASNRMTINGGKKQKKKKISFNNKVDILYFHQEKLQYFEKLQKSLVKKKELLNSKKLSISEKNNLENEIRHIQEKKEEKEYLDKTLDIIEKYKVESTTNEITPKKSNNPGGLGKYLSDVNNIEKNKLVEEYCRVTNNGMMVDPFKLKFNNEQCDNCNGVTKNIENFTTCIECGCISKNSIHDYQISYKDLCDTVIKKNYEYKRPNRFKEILASLQAKENTDIPQYVIEAIRNEIKKDYSTDITSITVKKIKEYLKRLSLTAYYEHTPHILNSINGMGPVNIPTYIEDKLLEMFEEIQEPFEIVKEKVAPNRLSFLSYNYCLYKFCELLDLDEYKKHFTLLKSPEKLRVQDKIWKGICEMLKWEYVSSI